MPVQTLTTTDPQRFFDLRSTAGTGTHRLQAGVSGATVSHDFSGRVSVTTAEGDTITLSADLEANYRTGRYDVRSGSEEAAVKVGVEATRYSLQQQFGITVDGDLNEQELSDLHKLLQKISGIFRGFSEGRDERALAQTATVADQFRGLTTLSSLDVSVEVVRSVTLVAASVGTPGGAPVTAAAIPPPPNGTTAPTPSFDSSEDGGLPLFGNDAQFESLIQQIFDALKEAETELHKFQKYLPDFFEKLRDDLTRSLQGSVERNAGEHDQILEQAPEHEPGPTKDGNVLTAYRSVHLVSSSFSIQS